MTTSGIVEIRESTISTFPAVAGGRFTGLATGCRFVQQAQRMVGLACISRLPRGKAEVRNPSGAMDPHPRTISRA
jgi:hypothetical protein